MVSLASFTASSARTRPAGASARAQAARAAEAPEKCQAFVLMRDPPDVDVTAPRAAALRPEWVPGWRAVQPGRSVGPCTTRWLLSVLKDSPRLKASERPSRSPAPQ